MDHFKQEKTFAPQKLGFHYFQDVERFNHKDARFWIGKLKEINAKWLVVNNPRNRAIPEEFIKTFLDSGINLIINFNENLSSTYTIDNVATLLHVYSKWGVKYACLFKQPNLIASWGEGEWNKIDVVASHLEMFIQFSNTCIENQIQPIFSPLAPGGDYWDLAFLEESLKIIAQSQDSHILDTLILSAFGWTWGNPIDWGAGGKNKWKAAKPFQKNGGHQNQLGFRTFEWYLEISEKVLKKKLPIMIFAAGFNNTTNTSEAIDHPFANMNMASITSLLAGGNIYDPQNPQVLLSPIAKEVIGCNLFILSSYSDKNIFPYRWFSSDGKPLDIAKNFGAVEKSPPKEHKAIGNQTENSGPEFQFKYPRYILISENLKSDMPDLLEKLDTYIRKYKPQIGFSKSDAQDAAYVLVVTKDKENYSLAQSDEQIIKNVIKIITPSEICELQGYAKNE